MKKSDILAIIIKRITEDKNTYDDKFKDYYKVCHYIYIQYHINLAFRLFLWMEKSMFIQEHIWRK